MDLSADHILVVFLLTTLAGLATGIGGFIAFFMKRTDTWCISPWWNCWEKPSTG